MSIEEILSLIHILAAHYCRLAYEAGFSPICPLLYLPLFLNDPKNSLTASGHTDPKPEAPEKAVSYTHLDVYKRQSMRC